MSKRRPRVCLILCPGWSLTAPALGLALLKSVLLLRGYEVETVDLGPLFWNTAPEEITRAWDGHLGHRLQDRRFAVAWWLRAPGAVEEAVRRVLDTDPDVVGFSVYTTTWHMSALLAERLKHERPGLSVVFGGPELSRLFDHGGRAMRDQDGDLALVDAAIPGEGEEALIALLSRWTASGFEPSPGAYVRKEDAFVWTGEAKTVDLDGMPFPDFGGFRARDYGNTGRLMTYFSRGCVRKCVFCDVDNVWGGWRSRRGTRVADEVEHLAALHPEARDFMFGDPLVNASMKELLSFCGALRAKRAAGRLREVSWRGYAVVRPETTDEVAAELRAAGCEELWFGIESGSQRVLDAMKKGFRIPVANANLRACRRAGIKTGIMLIIGFPTEASQDFEQTLGFIRRNAAHISHISATESAFIGNDTPLHRRREAYTVEAEGFHPMYWTSLGGANHVMERYRRLLAMRRCAEQEGIPIWTPEPEHVLAAYKAHRELDSV